LVITMLVKLSLSHMLQGSNGRCWCQRAGCKIQRADVGVEELAANSKESALTIRRDIIFAASLFI